MEPEQIFFRFNPWWQEEYKFPGIIREKYLSLLIKEAEGKNVTFITGLRRVGKTTLVKQLVHKLIEKGIDKKHILFQSVYEQAV